MSNANRKCNNLSEEESVSFLLLLSEMSIHYKLDITVEKYEDAQC